MVNFCRKRKNEQGNPPAGQQFYFYNGPSVKAQAKKRGACQPKK
jgi:hypothetical protein